MSRWQTRCTKQLFALESAPGSRQGDQSHHRAHKLILFSSALAISAHQVVARILHQTLIYLKLTHNGNLKTCLVYVGKIVVYTQKLRTLQLIFPRNYFNTLVKRLSFQPAAIY